MKLKQGIPATELRPFSVEDPTGTGHRAPRGGTRARTRTTARAPTPPRATVARQSSATTQAASMAHAPAATEKKTGWLTVLIIIGLVFAGVQTAGVFLWRSYSQSQLKEQGELAHARIISVTQTNVTVNDARVYKIEAELRLPGREPFNATVEQSFSALEISRLVPESWVEVRYDPESSADFVITGRAIAAPSQEPELVELAPPAEPSPQTAPAAPAIDPSEAPAETEHLSCAQARACCRIVSSNNAGCDSYTNPHIPDESCRIALSAYIKTATALGKSCQGF